MIDHQEEAEPVWVMRTHQAVRRRVRRRRNLHGSAMSYYDTQKTNAYGQDNGASTGTYIRDSYLDHIDYGFTDTNAYGTVPDEVVVVPPYGRWSWSLPQCSPRSWRCHLSRPPPARPRQFKVKYVVPSSTARGTYVIGARCGGGNTGLSATLRVV